MKNFDGHGGRAKSEIMVTSTEQHITGRKTFFDINVLKPDNNDQAANKKYVDDEIKKIPSPDLSTYLKKDGTVEMTGNLDMGNQQITNLGANIQNTYDVVNLGFCDTKYCKKSPIVTSIWTIIKSKIWLNQLMIMMLPLKHMLIQK